MDICLTPFLRVTVTKVADPGDAYRLGNMHAPVVPTRGFHFLQELARPRPTEFLAPVVPSANL